MTHVKLPAGYEDWTSPGVAPLRVPYLRITAERIDIPHTDGEVVAVHWLMPPKPKPVLPDVKPGAVLRYTSKTGKPERAVRNFESWCVYGAGTSGRMNSAGDTGWSLEWSDADLIERVNADGFTVELEGL